MIWFDNSEEFLRVAEAFKESSSTIENLVVGQSVVSGYCNYCNRPANFSSNWKPDGTWTDLRGAFVCEHCNMAARLRLLANSARTLECDTSARALIFERVTAFYSLMKRMYPNIEGVEFAGPDLQSGSLHFLKNTEIVHQDMENTSYEDCAFDLIIHSDVMEHVPDYYKGLEECYRILKPGGNMLFSCPVYNHKEHKVRAERQANGDIRHILPEAYHGNPVSNEGALVFVMHGVDILDDLKTIGFNTASIGLEFNPISHIYSNGNPYYDEGHMWPIVIHAKK